jgi:hypothetical protein
VDRAGEAWALETLGTVAHRAGSDEEACGHWRAALALYEVMLDRNGAARTRTWLANPQAADPALQPRL